MMAKGITPILPTFNALVNGFCHTRDMNAGSENQTRSDQLHMLDRRYCQNKDIHNALDYCLKG